MADEITIDRSHYISSKRASESTGYAQDYIGHLARKGLVDARRIGGLWYISMDSLLGYKDNANSYKAMPPVQNKTSQDPDTIISLDGRDYISASRAAEITGYHQDYIGQLAREEKILSRRIGTRWYVDREGIFSHKESKDALLAAVQAQAVGIKHFPDTHSRHVADVSRPYEDQPLMKYVTDASDLLPSTNSVTETTKEHLESKDTAQTILGPSQTIPIRRIDSRQDSQKKLTKTPPRKRLAMWSGVVSVAATAVIVLVLGYASIYGSPLYTQEGKGNQVGFALAAQVREVLDVLASKLELLLVPEVSYQRAAK